LFVDGALGSRTAALCAPYVDDPGNSVRCTWMRRPIAEHVLACTAAGMQAGFHVIGDAAVAEVIAGFELAEKQVGRRSWRRAGIAGARGDGVRRAGGAAVELGRCRLVQPQFDATWGGPDGMYSQRMGAERGARLNPFSQLAPQVPSSRSAPTRR